MSLIRLLLPILILLYFLWKARRHRIYLLGIPFLQVMQSSIFFEELKIFWMPGRFTAPVNILEWTIVVWIISAELIFLARGKRLFWRDLFGPRLVMPEEGILLVICGVWLFNFFFGMFSYDDISGVLLVGAQLGSMFLGYLLVRGMISSAPPEELDRFIFSMVVVNTLAAALFVLDQGFRLPIYPEQMDRVQEFMGESITRMFIAKPRFSHLAVAYVLSRSRWGIKHWAILIITIASVFFSYTRSALIIVVITLALAFFLYAIKGKVSRLFVRISLVGTIGLVLMMLVSSLFPTETRYILARFQEIDVSSIAETRNMEIRLTHLRYGYYIIARDNIWTGLGMATANTHYAEPELLLWSSDFTWLATLFRYGLIGTALFAILWIMLIYRSFQKYIHQQSSQDEAYWMMFLLYSVALLINSFISYTIFDPRNYTLALWFMAFIVVRSVTQPKPVSIQEPR